MQSIAECIWTFSYYLIALLLLVRELIPTRTYRRNQLRAVPQQQNSLSVVVWSMMRDCFETGRQELSGLILTPCESVGSAADFFSSVSGTGFVSPADLPLDEEEDVEQAMCACLKLYSTGFPENMQFLAHWFCASNLIQSIIDPCKLWKQTSRRGKSNLSFDSSDRQWQTVTDSDRLQESL